MQEFVDKVRDIELRSRMPVNKSKRYKENEVHPNKNGLNDTWPRTEIIEKVKYMICGSYQVQDCTGRNGIVHHARRMTRCCNISS